MANQTNNSAQIIRFFLLASSAAFLIAAVLLGLDDGAMFSGFAQILMSPAQLTKEIGRAHV